MTDKSVQRTGDQTRMFRSAVWIATLITGGLAAGMASLWLVGAADGDEANFVLLIAVSLMATVVFAYPYRAGERWAWWVSWVMAATIASVFFFTDPGIGIWYLVVAAVISVIQIATYGSMSPGRDTPGIGLPRGAGRLYAVGWWVIFALAIASIVQHLWGLFAFAGDAEIAFVGLAAISVYAAVILLTDYRHRRAWAWWAMWIFIGAFASVVLYTTADIGPWYLGAAALMAAGQFLTRSSFIAAQPSVAVG